MTADAPCTQNPEGLFPLHRQTLTLGFIFLLLLGLLGQTLAGPMPYAVQTVAWENHHQQRLQGRIWLPQTPGPFPGVLLLHGVAGTERQVWPAARSLAASGYAVMTFNRPGQSEAAQLQDILAAIAFFRTQPQLQDLSLVGHSQGANLAQEAASLAGEIQQVVAVGMRPSAAGSQHLTGLYDSLHPPWVSPWQGVSPSANHHTEMQDPHILLQLQTFLLPDVEPVAGAVWRESLRAGSHFLLALALLGILATQYPFAPQAYAAVLSLALLCGGLLLAGYLGWLAAELCAVAICLLLAGYLLGQIPGRFLAGVGSCLGALWLAREGAGLLRATYAVLLTQEESSALLWWPLAAWQSLVYYPQALQRSLEALLFWQLSPQLEPGWLLIVFFLAEALFPGWWLHANRLVLKPQRRAGARWLLLLGLSLLLLGLVLWRLQEGYLQPETWLRIRPLLWAEILPMALFLSLFYRLWRRKKCPRDGSNVRPTV